jgi:ribosome maturation factor RimP
MTIAFIKLPGLDQDKILSFVEPILAKHGVDAVELVWRGDSDGKVLDLTLERPGSTRSGEDITVDLCSDISRELSALFDEEENVLPGKYRLEVGSPGVERALYLADDYKRFAGQEVKVKLLESSDDADFVGLKTIRGKLSGLDGDGRVVLETDHGDVILSLEQISSARLVFSWGQTKRASGGKKSPGGSGTKSREMKRSNQNGRG